VFAADWQQSSGKLASPVADGGKWWVMELIQSGTRRTRQEMLAAAVQAHEEQQRRHVTAAENIAGAMLELQSPEGYWCGELSADSTLESDYILLQLWMHPPLADGVWNPPSRARIDKAVKAILDRQQADGGWWIYPGGGAEVNATARAYTTLKLAGVDPESEPMRLARERVLALGGLQACNSYTKINLGLFGLYPRKYVPTIPPEIVLVPGDVIYEMSSWTRAILVPLSIVQAIGSVKPTPRGMNVNELLHPQRKLSLPKRDAVSLIFTQVDRAVKIWERRGLKNIRARAIREAERWMMERTRYSDGLGAIYPSMMYLIMALESMGYAPDQPDLVEGIRQFEKLLIETGDRFQFQPCVSPVWDTAICAFALGELGEHAPERIPPDRLTKCADWLLDKEVRRKGDWSVKRPELEPSGWAFEFANEHYPDIDDTAMVLLALRHAKATDPDRQARAERRAVNWLIGMQGSDGGWAAFDVDNDWSLLNKVPFADHNAMLDPACPDITGRVLEALSRMGLPAYHSTIRRGVEFLMRTQERDGSWYGRWGVNYIYGTFLALRGLAAAKATDAVESIRRGYEFLAGAQNHDGGWGESCGSYRQSHYVQASSTPSQTAWALLGLAAAGDTDSGIVQRGVKWLLDRQKADGRWDEDLMTGTGFPNVFYLNYHLYRDYFPLLALATLHPERLKKAA
jgi:squalene-hopene/tetraprenyl-beta-curcumene cyclase